MIRLPPRSTRTDTLFPYTTLFRSGHHSRQSSGKDLVAPASSGHVLVPLGRNRRETIRTQKCSWHMLKRGIAAIVLLGPVIDDPALPRWRCNPPDYGCRLGRPGSGYGRSDSARGGNRG